MVADPDQVHDHRPTTCTECHTDLAPDSSIGYQRRQVRDIGLVTVTVSEHRAHTCACPCGARTTAAFPDEIAASPSSYGPHLRALAVYLMVFQHIPVERTAQLIHDVTGAAVSTGWVASLLGQAHHLVGDSLKLIRALLTLAHVVHVDETTTRIKEVRCWLHMACTEHLTLLGLAPRSRAGAESLGILPDFTGTLVHDSLALYNAYSACAHQLCRAHLIRELTAAEQDHSQELWPAQVRSALGELARQAGKVQAGECERMEPQVLLTQQELFGHGVAGGWPSSPGWRARSSPKPATCWSAYGTAPGRFWPSRTGLSWCPSPTTWPSGRSGLSRPRSRSPGAISPSKGRWPGSVCVPISTRLASTG